MIEQKPRFLEHEQRWGPCEPLLNAMEEVEENWDHIGRPQPQEVLKLEDLEVPRPRESV